jgi:hypothetical protein
MAEPARLHLHWQEEAPPNWQGATHPGKADGLNSRVRTLQEFALRARHWLIEAGWRSGTLSLQLHDEDPGLPCLRFDAPLEPDGLGPLIPDPYALASQGFAAVRASFSHKPLPPWRQRLPIAIWRGASTGTPQLTAANLAANRRVQLSHFSRVHAGLLDARLTALVQADPTMEPALIEQLQQQELLAPRLTPWQLALHRWIVEIDGNVNSWGLLWKLLSGSCVVRVESPRRQWYHHRLEPWVHVVPVAADLSNLAEQLIWCQQHPDACEAMAAASQQLGLEVVADLEEDQRTAVIQWANQWMNPARQYSPGIQPTGSTKGPSCSVTTLDWQQD